MANFGSYDNFVSLFNAIKTKFLHKSDLRELTQSEYNALTAEEKLAEDKYYYVLDAETTGAEIDDTVIAADKVWSSSKTNSELGLKANSADVPVIDDTTTALNKVWSSSKVNTELGNRLSYADNAILGAKNLLPNNAVSRTVYGVTVTVNDDGSITVNGTATNSDAVIDIYNADGTELFVGKRVTLSGCPQGGSSSTYNIIAYRVGSQSGSTNTTYDYGNGVTFNWLNDGSGTKAKVGIIVSAGQTVSNLTFKPMLRLATDTDNTYVPYAMTNRELTEGKLSISDLQTITAASSDFADFKTRIAAL